MVRTDSSGEGACGRGAGYGARAGRRPAPVPEARPLDGRLRAEDVARAVVFMVTQPPHVAVNEIAVRPTAQER
ncbi:hypothetical protein [Streptomyces sp. NPDC048612]|uniref:hypothetical protein n=1 Tax=Streptomyces sp. NPDC048612 TaxID=3365579 RepID=UPI0037205E3F